MYIVIVLGKKWQPSQWHRGHGMYSYIERKNEIRDVDSAAAKIQI